MPIYFVIEVPEMPQSDPHDTLGVDVGINRICIEVVTVQVGSLENCGPMDISIVGPTILSMRFGKMGQPS
jgi:hypothetical protein